VLDAGGTGRGLREDPGNLAARAETGAADQAWFADALTGDLTRAMTVWRTVRVIGRGTAALIITAVATIGRAELKHLL